MSACDDGLPDYLKYERQILLHDRLLVDQQLLTWQDRVGEDYQRGGYVSAGLGLTLQLRGGIIRAVAGAENHFCVDRNEQLPLSGGALNIDSSHWTRMEDDKAIKKRKEAAARAYADAARREAGRFYEDLKSEGCPRRANNETAWERTLLVCCGKFTSAEFVCLVLSILDKEWITYRGELVRNGVVGNNGRDYGLMQCNADTVAKGYGDPNSRVWKFDPCENVRMGCRILRDKFYKHLSKRRFGVTEREKPDLVRKAAKDYNGRADYGAKVKELYLARRRREGR